MRSRMTLPVRCGGLHERATACSRLATIAGPRASASPSGRRASTALMTPPGCPDARHLGQQVGHLLVETKTAPRGSPRGWCPMWPCLAGARLEHLGVVDRANLERGSPPVVQALPKPPAARVSSGGCAAAKGIGARGRRRFRDAPVSWPDLVAVQDDGQLGDAESGRASTPAGPEGVRRTASLSGAAEVASVAAEVTALSAAATAGCSPDRGRRCAPRPAGAANAVTGPRGQRHRFGGQAPVGGFSGRHRQTQASQRPAHRGLSADRAGTCGTDCYTSGFHARGRHHQEETRRSRPGSAEVDHFVAGARRILADYQISALLMAIVLRGMGDEETPG